MMRNDKAAARLTASFGQIKDDGFNFDLIQKYFRNRKNLHALQVVSDKTCNDLDFEALFMYLDRTHSRVGQQYLYNRLRTIPPDNYGLELHEKIIDTFTRNAGLRTDVQKQLEILNSDEAFYVTTLFQEEHIKPPRWFFIVPMLSFTSLIALLLLPFDIRMVLVLLGVFVVNLVIHYLNKKNLFQYLGSIPQLLRLNKLAAKLHKEAIFRNIAPDLPESIGIINQVRNRMAFFRLEAGLQSDMEALFWAILELVKTLFLLEPLFLYGILKRLDTKRNEIEKVFMFVGEIDLLLSVASLRFGLESYCLPNISGTGLAAVQIYHPLIKNCVPNDISVAGNSVLLTGSNMSGKTSFIRTIGLNAITGLTINTCFAQSVSLPRACIYSAIRISDDLLNDKSYYFEEVLSIKDMLEAGKRHGENLFLLDEIFKGTNTIERISAGKAVLSALAAAGNIVFVSTHDIELADLLDSEYDLYHFSEIVNENNVDFDYKLKRGKLKNRNAIRILQMNGYPDNVIAEAIQLSEWLDTMSLTGNSRPQYEKRH
jgi:hypothetical protein